MNTEQMALPVAVSPEEVARKKTLGGAIELCAQLAGYELDKQLQDVLGCDKGQLSRWQSGQEGIIWPKFKNLMDKCGNDAPLLWMNHDRGFDLYAMRKRESETEKQNRLLREENAALRRVLIGGTP